MSALPRVGEAVPVDRFFVSKMNVRAEEEFGVGEEDEALQAHLSTDEIVQPFIARPEDKDGHFELGMGPERILGYGVVVGRRRFLARRGRVSHFVAGKDVLIQELTDEEALDKSLKENLAIFRRDLDPITRGDKLNELLSKSARSLRDWARKWNVSPSTLSDWIRVANTSPKMREALRKGIVPFFDGLQVVALKLGTETQENLGELALSEGLEAFRRELARFMAGKGKRGVPRGVYIILRTPFDKRYKPDLELFEKLRKLAEEKGKRLEEYVKEILRDYVKSLPT